MPRPARSNGAETRQRILEVALELFTERGYDKTSLRDIAEQLRITKAALYYYFERKEDILLELHLQLHSYGTAALDRLEAIPDGPERYAAWPELMYGFIEMLSTQRGLLIMHRRNPGAINALHADERNRLENEELEARMVRILSSPALTLDQRVRMAASMGIFTEVMVESGMAFEDVPEAQFIGIVQGLIAEILGVRAPVPEPAPRT